MAQGQISRFRIRVTTSPQGKISKFRIVVNNRPTALISKFRIKSSGGTTRGQISKFRVLVTSSTARRAQISKFRIIANSIYTGPMVNIDGNNTWVPCETWVYCPQPGGGNAWQLITGKHL